MSRLSSIKMIVFQNSLIVISYAPETDILLVEWPSSEPYSVLEVKESHKLFVEVIKKYDAKKVLINAVSAVFNFDYADYLDLIELLTDELSKTRVEKVARVYTTVPEREAIMKSTLLKVSFPFLFQNFNSKEEAMHWLISQK